MRTTTFFVGTLLYYQSHQLFRYVSGNTFNLVCDLALYLLTVFIGPGGQFLFITFSIISSFYNFWTYMQR